MCNISRLSVCYGPPQLGVSFEAGSELYADNFYDDVSQLIICWQLIVFIIPLNNSKYIAHLKGVYQETLITMLYIHAQRVSFQWVL